MRKAFTTELYVKVRRNGFTISALADPAGERAFTPDQPFTTERLLVGQFSAAEACLSSALKSFSGKGLLPKSISLIMHPLEMVDGGLSEVEERLFRELAMAAGARKVALWVGEELGLAQAKALLAQA